VVCSEKNGLYDGTDPKAQNFIGEFCKFCAYGFEMIMFLFLLAKEKNYQNLNTQKNNILLKFQNVINIIK
jgi:hypothetical protein